MILGANRLAISVPDIDQATGFYCDILGFVKVMDFGWSVGFKAIDRILAVTGTSARGCMVRTTNLIIELFEFGAMIPQSRTQIGPSLITASLISGLAVTDLDAECARLCKAGMRVSSTPVDPAPGVRTVYGRDSFGKLSELEESYGRTAPHDPVWAAELPPETQLLS